MLKIEPTSKDPVGMAEVRGWEGMGENGGNGGWGEGWERMVGGVRDGREWWVE